MPPGMVSISPRDGNYELQWQLSSRIGRARLTICIARSRTLSNPTVACTPVIELRVTVGLEPLVRSLNRVPIYLWSSARDCSKTIFDGSGGWSAEAGISRSLCAFAQERFPGSGRL